MCVRPSVSDFTVFDKYIFVSINIYRGIFDMPSVIDMGVGVNCWLQLSHRN